MAVLNGCTSFLEVPVEGSGTYAFQLIASNAGGCADTANAEVLVLDADGLFVPNAFSPNADGVNDWFGVPYVDPTPGFSMRIFDRWGQEIFASTDPLKVWDGTWAGTPVPTGVFAYLVKAPDPCSPDDQRERRGHVVLVR
jgi:gliding motility-associated-like protein